MNYNALLSADRLNWGIGHVCAFVYAHLREKKTTSHAVDCVWVFSGNAAITLRSRLKVKVVKEMLQRESQQPQDQERQQQQPQQNGLPSPGHANSEASKVTLQLQVEITWNRVSL